MEDGQDRVVSEGGLGQQRSYHGKLMGKGGPWIPHHEVVEESGLPVSAVDVLGVLGQHGDIASKGR